VKKPNIKLAPNRYAFLISKYAGCSVSAYWNCFFLGWGVGDAILAWHRANQQDKRLATLSADELPELNEDDYVIPFSEIQKVELKKYVRGAKINIITDEKNLFLD